MKCVFRHIHEKKLIKVPTPYQEKREYNGGYVSKLIFIKINNQNCILFMTKGPWIKLDITPEG